MRKLIKLVKGSQPRKPPGAQDPPRGKSLLLWSSRPSGCCTGPPPALRSCSRTHRHAGRSRHLLRFPASGTLPCGFPPSSGNISERPLCLQSQEDFSLPGTSGVQPCKVMMTLFILRYLLLVKDTQSTKVHKVKLSFPSTPLSTPRLLFQRRPPWWGAVSPQMFYAREKTYLLVYVSCWDQTTVPVAFRHLPPFPGPRTILCLCPALHLGGRPPQLTAVPWLPWAPASRWVDQWEALIGNGRTEEKEAGCLLPPPPLLLCPTPCASSHSARTPFQPFLHSPALSEPQSPWVSPCP